MKSKLLVDSGNVIISTHFTWTRVDVGLLYQSVLIVAFGVFKFWLPVVLYSWYRSSISSSLNCSFWSVQILIAGCIVIVRLCNPSQPIFFCLYTHIFVYRQEPWTLPIHMVSHLHNLYCKESWTLLPFANYTILWI